MYKTKCAEQCLHAGSLHCDEENYLCATCPGFDRAQAAFWNACCECTTNSNACKTCIYEDLKGINMTDKPQPDPSGQDDYVEKIDNAFAQLKTIGAEIEEQIVGTVDPNGIAASDGGAKLDYGKTKWYLMPWAVIEGVAKVMTFGASKYSENGWQEVPMAKERYFAAMMRHYMLMTNGEYIDPDSGLPHWAHFCCNAVFLGFFYNKK